MQFYLFSPGGFERVGANDQRTVQTSFLDILGDGVNQLFAFP